MLETLIAVECYIKIMKEIWL